MMIILVSRHSFSQESIWSHYYNVLKLNNGLDQNQQIKFDFPWKKDRDLLIKLDQLTQQYLTENKIDKIFHITTNATDRLSIEIFSDLHIPNQFNGLIVKKHWRGLFGTEFSYKIIPLDYLRSLRPLGKIDKYEIGFVEFIISSNSLRFIFPQDINFTKQYEISFEVNKIKKNQILNISLITQNSQLVKIDIN